MIAGLATPWMAAVLLAAAPPRSPANPYELDAAPTPRNRIDQLVAAQWRALDIEPARVCSDAVFLRRAYLDLIGTLPTAQEAREFLADTRPDKRRRLVDQLLERDEWADYWSLKWCDLLRVKSEFPINLWPNAVQAYHRWVRQSLRENKPYDQFVRELLTTSGSNFRDPPANFYRAVQNRSPEGLAAAAALTFMGVRIEHWPEERREGLAAMFANVAYKSTREWKEEIVYFDPLKKDERGKPLLPRSATLPDGSAVTLTPDRDPRRVFADWLIQPDNPWFARNAANRVWYWLLGRGIIHEPDDIRPDNPPSVPGLLEYLQQELVAADYDVKHLYRLIANSAVYQLSPIPRSQRPEAEACFAYYPTRRLEAEVLIDAINQITGTTEEYSSRTPEPYTFLPPSQRTIALADGSITSSFLELFGRPPRDTGLESERDNRVTPAQRLHLLNSSHIQRKILQGPKLRAFARFSRNPQAGAAAMYLTILSRYPTAEELAALADYAKSGGVRPQDVMVDAAWALLNSAEFLYRH